MQNLNLNSPPPPPQSLNLNLKLNMKLNLKLGTAAIRKMNQPPIPVQSLRLKVLELSNLMLPENMKDEDEKLSGKGNSLEALVPPYKICLSSELPQSEDLSDVSDEQIEEAVIRIVECEGPVHSEEILQRIKSHTGLPRMLGKIKNRISDSMAVAESSGKILARGEFYWPLSEPADLLRRRDVDAYAKIEWICDEEIKEAVRFVLSNQYSTPMEDLIIQTSRVLGIKTTRKNTWDRIENLFSQG